MSNFQVICFGEILWDVFPNKKVIGGAPLNVALRLHSFGTTVAIVSRIGRDELGEGVTQYLTENGLPKQFVQTDKELPTGAVQVTLDEKGSASYIINKPVAWDAIEPSKEVIETVKNTPFFVFGSLAARGAMNRFTLQTLLDVANTGIFDVNLRPPDYDISMVYELMQKADAVKLNDEELDEICNELGCQETLLEPKVRWLEKISRTSTICVTKGAEGALLLFEGKVYEQAGYSVAVEDTVGAGDSFLATLIQSLFIKNDSPNLALQQACAMGALVASKAGANCKISEEEMLRLLSS